MLKECVSWASVLLIMVVFAASSCNTDNDVEVPDAPQDTTTQDTIARVIITVLKDSVNFVILDTVTVPVVQAGVRFYLNQLGGQIDTTILTNSDGKAEFIWFEDAIVQYDIIFGSFLSIENFVIVLQGETREFTINISD